MKAAILLVAVSLVAAGMGTHVLVHEPARARSLAQGSRADDDEELARGRELYVLGCSSCHGLYGEGGDRGPSLLRAGAASAYYYLSTGRMPLTDTDQPVRKPPAYTPAQIAQLVAYVASIGDGPPLPEVDVAGGDLSRGGVLYRAHCAPCHNAAGIGGALSYGRAAPSLGSAEPLVIASAMRIGPGQMPVFGPTTFPQEELNSVVRYALYLQSPENPGGLPLGGAGPVPEGLAAWLLGMGTLLLAVAWIGTRQKGS